MAIMQVVGGAVEQSHTRSLAMTFVKLRYIAHRVVLFHNF